MSENRNVKVLDAELLAQLPGDIFDVQTNVALIHQVVVAQLAAARQGTHSTKTRGEVAGGGAKPWRQKGTGRARQGSRRAPQWTGGGIVHGPKPRDYAQRTPKKMIRAALYGALSDRAREDRISVVGTLVSGEDPSTREALAALAALAGGQLLVVLSRDEDLAWLSLRNVPSVQVIVVDQLNAYDVLLADDIVFTTEALSYFIGGEVVTVADESARAKPAAKKAKAKAVAAQEAEQDEPAEAEPESEDEPAEAEPEQPVKKTRAKKAPVEAEAETPAEPETAEEPARPETAKVEAEAEVAEEAGEEADK
jgi:large subunit ribosomal protein L4